jgi:(E)-4-hydroxy-3-methylbut-2-enyl-diphosphate synthase
VYIDGEKTVTLRGDNIAREFTQIVDDYVARKYAARGRAAPDSPRSIALQSV